MAYIYNIPQPTDQLSNSQTQILANFTALGAIAGNSNNGSASLNTTAGFNFVYLPSQGTIPPITFPTGTVGIYSAVNSNTSVNELYVNKSNATQIPMTASYQVGTTGWSFLPSGIKMVWSRVNTGTMGSTPIVFSSIPNFPGFSNVFTINVNTSTNVNAWVTSVSNLGFTINLSGTSSPWYYTVLGN